MSINISLRRQNIPIPIYLIHHTYLFSFASLLLITLAILPYISCHIPCPIVPSGSVEKKEIKKIGIPSEKQPWIPVYMEKRTLYRSYRSLHRYDRVKRSYSLTGINGFQIYLKPPPPPPSLYCSVHVHVSKSCVPAPPHRSLSVPPILGKPQKNLFFQWQFTKAFSSPPSA